ncbi:unnamed protein product [Aphanomyces euteiches]|uniref:Glutathione transferase n=1 Tax=Aphanomyces euteiches TaxID=100861 RepID=A0A6G0XCN9_9STRA|nr:hypothetical protein Ae201684_005922 [Aphanomyces euteiches]KAH9069264.1 hypothetical protein Ae201684P_004952 [Aphanomyces euteiches]KAH9156082.1 hypothetical protein AeRB84_001978 [Aphanomyces euteiches]
MGHDMFIPSTIQPDHGYVILVVVLVAFVNLWAGMKVGAARRAYNIKYPQMYAEKSDEYFLEFNCVQRAHQNMVENLPVFLSLLIASSIYRPMWAALAGLIRVLGFIVYVISYSSGDPEKRLFGSFGFLGLFVSVGLCFEAAFRLVTA